MRDDSERYAISNSFKFLVVCSSAGMCVKLEEVGEWVDFQIININN